MVKSVNVVAVTVEVTCEAVAFLTNWRPTAFMVNVGMQDELEVLAVSDIPIECALTRSPVRG